MDDGLDMAFLGCPLYHVLRDESYLEGLGLERCWGSHVDMTRMLKGEDGLWVALVLTGQCSDTGLL